jgi:hypothetical protein
LVKNSREMTEETWCLLMTSVIFTYQIDIVINVCGSRRCLVFFLCKFLSLANAMLSFSLLQNLLFKYKNRIHDFVGKLKQLERTVCTSLWRDSKTWAMTSHCLCAMYILRFYHMSSNFTP